MRLAAVTIAVSVLFVGNIWGGGLQSLPKSSYLDVALIRDAIAAGEAGSVRPYLLRTPNGTRYNIAVYTPFVRVALAAYTAKRGGSQTQLEHLPEWLTQPDIHVVIRWPHEQPSRVVPDGTMFDRRMKLTQITVAPNGQRNLVDFIRPNWMTTDLSYLDAIGGVPFSDAAGAATFPPELIVANTDVLGWWYKDNNYFMSSGRIEVSDFLQWR